MKTKLLFCFALIIGICIPALAVDASVTNRPDPVAREVERLKNWEGDALEHIEETYYENTNSPIKALLDMAKAGQPEGILGIFQLIPYLTNTSPTKSTVSTDFHHLTDATRPFQVNEYIANIIVRAASHEFYLASGNNIVFHLGDSPLKDPAIIGWYQLQIEHWCSVNVNSSLERRKIADLNDWFHYNRFNAYRWLGESKSAKGRLPLERRVDFLVNDGSFDSMTRTELAACAGALAQIGDPQSVAAVRRACDYIRDYPEHSQFTDHDLFEAYHALATLGEKQAALGELKQYSDKHLSEMEKQAQQDFGEEFKKSKSW